MIIIGFNSSLGSVCAGTGDLGGSNPERHLFFRSFNRMKFIMVRECYQLFFLEILKQIGLSDLILILIKSCEAHFTKSTPDAFLFTIL